MIARPNHEISFQHTSLFALPMVEGIVRPLSRANDVHRYPAIDLGLVRENTVLPSRHLSIIYADLRSPIASIVS